MATESISTLKPKSEKTGPEREVELEFNFGDDLEDCVSLFGEKIVFANARRNMIVLFQGNVRRMLGSSEKKDGTVTEAKTDEEILEWAAEWKPGEVRRSKSKLEKADDLTDEMEDDELDALIKRAQEKKKARKAAAATESPQKESVEYVGESA